MRKLLLTWLLSLSIIGQTSSPSNAAPPAKRIDDFQLRDSHGTVHKLSDWQADKLVVVVFLSVECPLAKLYASRLAELMDTFGRRGARFVGVSCNAQDSPATMVRYLRLHDLRLPLLRDEDHVLADRFGAARSPEVFVLDEQRTVRYRGRIDDQYSVDTHRAAPTRRDLATALEELLDGKPVSQPVTEASGCLISRLARPAAKVEITYSKHVAPILQRHCLSCHRRGQIAPFALTSYKEAASWAEMMREVIETQRMPPWHANPKHGRFANDPSLSEQEKKILIDWVQGNALEGDPAELPPTPAFAEAWNIPKPDLVLAIPKPFTVPAEGVIEYQFFEVDPGFQEDKWVRAAEIRPGNRAVVHHCSVFLKPPGSDGIAAQGALGSFCLAATAVGTPPLLLPEGMAKFVPAGWRFVFIVHYTPIGSVQTDQTEIGLVFADPKAVKKEVATKLLVDPDLCIPPHAPDHRVEQSCLMPGDALLLAMFPHMHLRGKSFRYEAAYPDGTTEILLDVPRYDFNWQHRYVLAEPKLLPTGTVLRCIAHYDNSANNPANPDPNATVRTGMQSWDEMFNGYFDFALADQDLTQPPALGAVLRAAGQKLFQPSGVLTLVALGGIFLILNRWQKRVGSESEIS
jgi:peroxiredoxin